ncbi:MAG TPA: SAM-dependent methyltransferase [Streptosporangiaceae bacterium]
MSREDRSQRRAAYPPAGVDARTPNIARVYDAFLGGKDNFAADRQVLETALQVTPDAPNLARVNRAFLRRAVRYLVAAAGLGQILDIGSGLPNRGNVHEVAHELDPGTRVVYVDNDPVVYTHGQALLADARTTEVVTADLRSPAAILADPVVRKFIDFGQPVGLLLLAVLHHIDDDDDPAGIMATLRDAMPRGSYLAISSFRMPGEEHPEHRATAAELAQVFKDKLGSGNWRTDEEILTWFGDWELIEPGLVPLAEWRPDVRGQTRRDATYYGFAGGVARKT